MSTPDIRPSSCWSPANSPRWTAWRAAEMMQDPTGSSYSYNYLMMIIVISCYEEAESKYLSLTDYRALFVDGGIHPSDNRIPPTRSTFEKLNRGVPSA